MLLVALFYLLLATRFTVRGRLCLCGAQGSVQLEAGALGVYFHMDEELSLTPGGRILRPRYGPSHLKPPRRHSMTLRSARPYWRSVLRAGRMDRARLSVRLGLDDAAKTAVAAGAVRALVLSLLAGLDVPMELRVEPDFRSACFLVAVQGIFSARPGDIMFAMIRVLARRRRTARRGIRRAAVHVPAGTGG